MRRWFADHPLGASLAVWLVLATVVTGFLVVGSVTDDDAVFCDLGLAIGDHGGVDYVIADRRGPRSCWTDEPPRGGAIREPDCTLRYGPAYDGPMLERLPESQGSPAGWP